MAVRLVGVDTEDQRLPQGVIEATVGLGADDLAAGNTLAQANAFTNDARADAYAYTDAAVDAVAPSGGSFIGAYTTSDVPAASTVNPGFYYWDLTRAQPYWSDGLNWRDAGATSSPPVDPEDPVGQEVVFTLAPTATSFSPWITLTPGATGTVNWYGSDDVVIATGPTPTITDIPGDDIVTMRVESGAALVMSEVEIINLGFDHTQDAGPETPDAVHDYDPQPVIGVSSMVNLTNLRYFMAAETPLTGTLNFTGVADLVAVECYNALVTDVLFEGTSINRLCLEQNRITNLDLTPIAGSLRDLRCAHNLQAPADGSGDDVVFHSDVALPHLWHYCVRDQHVTQHLPQSQMPALLQFWAWGTEMETVEVPTSPVINSITLHHNPLTSATVDAWLVYLASTGVVQGTLNMSHADPPTAASAAARTTLADRGWSLLIPLAVGADEGWEYAATTQVPWVAGDLTTSGTTSTSVTAGVLTTVSNSYGNTRMRPAARNAGDVFFEVTVDRSEIDGSVGTDFWAIFVNANSAGGNGTRVTLRWPEVVRRRRHRGDHRPVRWRHRVGRGSGTGQPEPGRLDRRRQPQDRLAASGCGGDRHLRRRQGLPVRHRVLGHHPVQRWRLRRRRRQLADDEPCLAILGFDRGHMTALGIVASAHVTATGFDPLSIGWHTAFWAEDPAWSHPADGAAVAQWDDATGNARHATQASGGAQPLWRASVAALNSQPAVDFDGSDALLTGSWTAIANGWSIVLIGHTRVVAASDNFLEGDDNSHRCIVGIVSSGGNKWRFATGVGVVGPLADTTKHLFVGVSGTGTAGVLEIDGTATTGDAGTHTNTALTLGSNNTGTGNFIEGEIAFVGLYATDVRAHGSWSAFEAWVTSHYGITIA